MRFASVAIPCNIPYLAMRKTQEKAPEKAEATAEAAEMLSLFSFASEGVL